MRSSRTSIQTGRRVGRATLLRAGQTPLEPLPTLATPGPRRPNESHTGPRKVSVGSRIESDGPGTWTEPRQAPVLRSMKQVAAFRAVAPMSGRPSTRRWYVPAMEPWGAMQFGDPCKECAFDWSLSPQAAIQWVSHLQARLTAITSSAEGSERRESGGWSVTEYVCHVGDNLRQWAERVQGARLAGVVAVSGFNPDDLALARRYETLPLAAALWSIGPCRRCLGQRAVCRPLRRDCA